MRGFKEEVDNFQVMYHRTNKLNNKLIILFSFGRRYCSKIIIVYIAFIIDITLTFRFSVIPNIKINIINYIALSIALYYITAPGNLKDGSSKSCDLKWGIVTHRGC